MPSTAKINTYAKSKKTQMKSLNDIPRKQRSPAKKGEPKKLETIPPLRLTQDEKSLIYQAAELSNQSVSEFVINNILRISLKVTENEIILIDDDEFASIAKKRIVPKSAHEKMKSAMRNAAHLNVKS
jgi:uncharacterized protein (DUF1778 family)